MFYFVRVNGNTLHNNPAHTTHYVLNEPPLYPTTRFNATQFCLDKKIIRIGWPDTGDLQKPNKTGALAHGYSLDSLKPYIQTYLRTFQNMALRSIVLMPDSDKPGAFYMGEVVQRYHYFHQIPEDPYEHSHRLGVKWDRNANNEYRVYQASQLGIQTQAGFWRRAFADLMKTKKSRVVIPLLESARQDITP